MANAVEYIHNIPSQDDFTTEKINAVNNGLLGEYVDGNYVISRLIADELISCKKTKKSTFKNSVFCTCYLPAYGEIVFEIVYEKNTSNNTAKASIYVLENEYKVNGYLQNTIKTKLTEYVDDLDGFIEKSYQRFNVGFETGEGKDYKVTDDPNLQGYVVAKKQFMQSLNKLTEEKYMGIYKSFFEERLKLLKSLNNPFSKAVLDKFNLEYQKIEKYFLQNKDYKALSELLDKCTEDIYGVNTNFKEEEREYREKILPIIIAFSQKAEEIFAKATPKAMESLKKNDREKIDQINMEINKVKKEKANQKQIDTIETTASDNKGKIKDVMENLSKMKQSISSKTSSSASSKTNEGGSAGISEAFMEATQYFNNSNKQPSESRQTGQRSQNGRNGGQWTRGDGFRIDSIDLGRSR